MIRLRRLRPGLLAQIGFALALVGTVPLAIAAVQLAKVNREALVEQLLRTHTVSARTAADAIDSFLAARRSLASTLLLSPELAADPTSAVGQLRLSGRQRRLLGRSRIGEQRDGGRVVHRRRLYSAFRPKSDPGESVRPVSCLPRPIA